jgi:hypothetical protein
MQMNIAQLEGWLQEFLPQHMAGIDFDSRHFRVNYVLNWGGFVNHSFTISDGSKRYHLKITNEEERIPRLLRWREMHEILEQQYRAPRLVDWIDLPEIGFAGLLFEHVEGRSADLCRSQHLLTEIINVANSLHHDEVVRSRLEYTAGTRTYFDHFVETYIDRFNSDLEIISGPYR